MATAQQDKVCRVLPERTGGRREPFYHLFYSRMNVFYSVRGGRFGELVYPLFL